MRDDFLFNVINLGPQQKGAVCLGLGQTARQSVRPPHPRSQPPLHLDLIPALGPQLQQGLQMQRLGCWQQL